jgi:hypothetical protein
MTHPSLEELLEQDDGIAGAGVAEHLAACPDCSRERAALRLRRERLRALPPLPPPGRAWPNLQTALARPRRRERVARLALVAAAAAVAALALWHPGRAAHGRAAEGALAGWIERSQRLEGELLTLEEPSVVEVQDADARAELEDEIAWVDQCIGELDPAAADEERATLWRTRVSLLESLLQLRRPPPAVVSL